MATTRHWLNLSYGFNGDVSAVGIMSFGMFKSFSSCKAKNSHVLLPVFCIANSRSVPIFGEVPSSSG